jgi:hypothetical protein
VTDNPFSFLLGIKMNSALIFALEFKKKDGKDDAIIFSTKSNNDMKEFIATLELFKKTGTEYNIVEFANI